MEIWTVDITRGLGLTPMSCDLIRTVAVTGARFMLWPQVSEFIKGMAR